MNRGQRKKRALIPGLLALLIGGLVGEARAQQSWGMTLEEPTGIYRRDDEVVSVRLSFGPGEARAGALRVLTPEGRATPSQLAGVETHPDGSLRAAELLLQERALPLPVLPGHEESDETAPAAPAQVIRQGNTAQPATASPTGTNTERNTPSSLSAKGPAGYRIESAPAITLLQAADKQGTESEKAISGTATNSPESLSGGIAGALAWIAMQQGQQCLVPGLPFSRGQAGEILARILEAAGGPVPDQRFIKNHAEGIQVGARIDGAAIARFLTEDIVPAPLRDTTLASASTARISVAGCCR